MGSTTATALGTKMRLATWAAPPSSRMTIRNGSTLEGTFAVLPRTIRVYMATMITEAATSSPSSVRRRALKARWGRVEAGVRRDSTGTRASLPVPARRSVERKNQVCRVPGITIGRDGFRSPTPSEAGPDMSKSGSVVQPSPPTDRALPPARRSGPRG